MESKEIVSTEEIQKALDGLRFTTCADDGRMMLAELLLKAGAGCRSSYTEEAFLGKFRMLKSDRTPNKKGRMFLCSMFYTHSNGRPECFKLMQAHRS